MLELPPANVLFWASVIVGLGAAVQGGVGIGFGLISAPLLVQLDAGFLPAPLVAATMTLVVLTALRDRHGIDFSGVAWASLGRVPTSVLGAWVVASVGSSDLQKLIAGIVLLGVVMSAMGFDFRPRPLNLFVAGALSGFMGTTSSIGGPPMALVYQGESGERLRGTLAVLFVVGGMISLLALSFAGQFGRSEWVMAALLIPGVVVGFVLSNWLKGPLDRGYTRIVVLLVSGSSAALLLMRPFF
ncbi:sulfite exporter TauE/SafE family protein [Myxococcota bacterium]|nr:sulfite exporter TauE/SafE family protein [Myxococcota bacterium]